MDDNKQPKVTILLLNYNGWKDTLECLESLYRSTYFQWEVVIIDNGSTDESILKINDWVLKQLVNEPWHVRHYEDVFYNHKQETYKSNIVANGNITKPSDRITLLKIDSNLGYAGGNNVGMKYAIDKSHQEYVLILNNDTITNEKLLNELIAVSESDNKSLSWVQKFISMITMAGKM